MQMKREDLEFRVDWSEAGQEFVGLCSEFPSLSWLEKTPEKALEGIQRLASEVLEDLTPPERSK